MPGADRGHHRVAHRAVVDGVGQGVAGARRRQVDLEVEVDLERLVGRLLVGRAAPRHQPQAPQLDPVVTRPPTVAQSRPRPPARGPSGPSWRPVRRSVTEMACGP